jgi:hypothetical protein
MVAEAQELSGFNNSREKSNIQSNELLLKGHINVETGNCMLIFDQSQYKKKSPTQDNKSTTIIPKQKKTAGWQTIKYESFEGAFPNDWVVYASSGYADAYWDDTSFKSAADSWSCFCADAGSAGTGWGGQYVNDMYAWMTYGPFDLSDAYAAEVFFYHWTKTEPNYDKFHYVASKNGINYYGSYFTGNCTDDPGNISGWLTKTFDLTSVYSIGDLTGESQVWLAFVFSSDASVISDGTYLDEITIRKQALPNLTFDPAHCSYTFSDPDLQIDVRTINNSSENSGASRIGYYLSSDNTIGTNDYRIASHHVSELTPGAYEDNSCNINVRTAATVPALPVGTHTYYIGFVIDYQNSVNEFEENDNSCCLMPSITFLHTDVKNNPNQPLQDDFVLRQNVPNPFNPDTRIEFDLHKSANVVLFIYDINGNEIKRYAPEFLSAGTHTLEWNGQKESGDRVASGMYFYRIEAKTKEKTFVDVKKMIFMK